MPGIDKNKEKGRVQLMRKTWIILVLAAIFAGAAWAASEGPAPLRDMSCAILSEIGEESVLKRVYVKDGVFYMQMSGQFWQLDAADLEVLRSEITTHLTEHDYEQIWEIKEGEVETVGEWQASRQQVFSKETGALLMEMWLAPDVFLPVREIHYDEDGQQTEVKTLLEFSLEPDFSKVDLSQALPLSFTGEVRKIELTEEQFKEMVPWYDLQGKIAGSFELSSIEIKAQPWAATYAQITVTYRHGEQALRLLIMGEKENLCKKPSPSDFLPLLSFEENGFYLRPAATLQSLQIYFGFLDQIHLYTGESFLRSVVLY